MKRFVIYKPMGNSTRTTTTMDATRRNGILQNHSDAAKYYNIYFHKYNLKQLPLNKIITLNFYTLQLFDINFIYILY